MERLFKAGDVITFSGTATDAEDGTLPASAYIWNIDFLHDRHVHPGTPITGVTSGTFTIPTSGHDFNGFTRYRVSLTVTDSSGLQSTSSVTVFPQKVNLTFAAAPAGATVFLDGIAHTAPFVYDDLIGFNHTIEAPNQTIGGNTYNFASWSDGGAQTHTIVVPEAEQTYTANLTAAATAPPAFVQVNAATPQTNQSTVTVTYTSAQAAGNTNILAIGWNNATSNITSVTDSAGNTYQLAVPTARGTGVSQAIYYATNIKAAAAGTNTVTVTFNTATPFVDIRALEYSGLDPVNPFDVGTSASGTGTSANSGTVTTTAANALIFGAGITTGGFSAAGTNFTTRIITTPDADIAQDRIVTAAGPYSATAPVSGAWVMQVATFKAAAATTGDTTPPTAAITAPPQRNRLGHIDPERQRHRQCRGGRRAVPARQQSPGRRGHHLPLHHHPQHHHGCQRHPHPGRARPRRRRQLRYIGTRHHHRQQRGYLRHLPSPSPRPTGTVSGTITVTANATDNAGVAGVQFLCRQQ